MTPAARHHLVAVLDMMWAHRSQLLYPPGDERGSLDAASWALREQQMQALLAHGGRAQFDCTAFDSWCWKAVGAWPYSQPGYTGSHLASLLPVYTDARQAGIGAEAVFGAGTGHHGALVLEPDPVHGDPLLQSHGRPGMDRLRLSALAASQAASGHPGVRFCTVARL